MSDKFEATIDLSSDAKDSVPHQIVMAGLAQLKFIQLRNDTEALRRDIQGYEEVIKMSEDTVRDFLETKHQTRMDGSRMDNLDTIEFLKANGRWK